MNSFLIKSFFFFCFFLCVCVCPADTASTSAAAAVTIWMCVRIECDMKRCWWHYYYLRCEIRAKLCACHAGFRSALQTSWPIANGITERERGDWGWLCMDQIRICALCYANISARVQFSIKMWWFWTEILLYSRNIVEIQWEPSLTECM